MTTHDYELGYKQKLAELNKQLKLQNMENLTEKQKSIIATITNEFSKINQAESSTDILSLIDNALNEKHILRKELEILDKYNRECIKNVVNEVVQTLQVICDKYNFSLKCTEILNSNEYHLQLIFNGYFDKHYTDSLLNAKAVIELPIEFKDSIRYVSTSTPIFRHYGSTSRYQNKEQFIKYFVDETIKILKSNI